MSTFRGLYLEQSQFRHHRPRGLDNLTFRTLSLIVIYGLRLRIGPWGKWNVTLRRTLVGGTFKTSSEFVILHTFEVKSKPYSITERKHWTVAKFQSVVTFPASTQKHIVCNMHGKELQTRICIVCIVCTDRLLYMYEDACVACTGRRYFDCSCRQHGERVFTKLPKIYISRIL